MNVVYKIVSFSKLYPITRGMAAYSVIWPTSSLIQQSIAGKEKLDFTQALRFSIYGGLYVAPTLFAWLRIASFMWPQHTLRAALTKASVEQITFAPFIVASFYFLMSLLEDKSMEGAVIEVKEKFLPTWKVGACVWPVLQTINHTLIRERNKVIFVGFCSLMWTCFLAYMKQLESHNFIKVDKN